jgi:hypothetical protein
MQRDALEKAFKDVKYTLPVSAASPSTSKKRSTCPTKFPTVKLPILPTWKRKRPWIWTRSEQRDSSYTTRKRQSKLRK